MKKMRLVFAGLVVLSFLLSKRPGCESFGILALIFAVVWAFIELIAPAFK
jgi:hypothetical protein